MSQNILVLIRSDIKALDEKVTDLQQQVDDVKTSLPDNLSEKLDAQAQALDTITSTVNDIHDTLNPEIPDLPLVPGLLASNFKKSSSSTSANKK
ncbi:P10 [Artaxa digramma nucleopolyhedrovirus]|uniref:P10 n=1 Tax=Artaxa digramma nucleopolyhedrovirus TaxID=3070910 RepID=A0AAE6UZH4_9ABAC|nr:P10 [Euproctis digramma nucleopolyhedrovirus]QHB21711.1 P10 [Artaxa digramma nucleopolyhedrovirus]